MRAVSLHRYHEDPCVDEIPRTPALRARWTSSSGSAAPGSAGPTCTSSRGGGRPSQRPRLPYVIGHENAGWVHAVGDGRHQRLGGRHGDPAPAAELWAVPRLPRRRRHALRQRLLPGAVRPRRRHGGVPADVRPCLRQARPGDRPGRRRRARRRRDHRLPRRPQGGHPAAPRARPRWCRSGGLGHIGIPYLPALTAARMSSSTATPTR